MEAQTFGEDCTVVKERNRGNEDYSASRYAQRYAICALSEPPSSGTTGDNATERNYLTFSRWGIPEITDRKCQLIDSTWQVLQQCRGTKNASEITPARNRNALLILKGSQKHGEIDVMTQICTMKCPHCGSTGSKEKPEQQFKCEGCGWKL